MATPLIMLVTDRRRVAPAARTEADAITALERLLDEAIAAGVDVIQVRERDLAASRLLGLVVRLVRRAVGTPTRIAVNDRIDVAIAAGAPAVHLPSSSVPTTRARTIAREMWMSRAIHDAVACAAECAAAHPPDAFVFGTVFATTSKPAGAPVAGLAGLTAAVRASTRPVIAIGGITPARAADVWSAGAAGVAAIGLFLPPGAAPESVGPARAVAALRAAVPARSAAC